MKKTKSAPMDLTMKQIKFAKHFMRSLSREEAARAVGVSKATANKWLRTQPFRELLYKEIKRREERVEITADQVLREYGRLAFSDVTEVVSIERGVVKIKDTDEIPKDTRLAIGEISESRDGIKVKMIDKKGALDSLAKCLGMFTDTIKKEELPLVEIG